MKIKDKQIPKYFKFNVYTDQSFQFQTDFLYEVNANKLISSLIYLILQIDPFFIQLC